MGRAKGGGSRSSQLGGISTRMLETRVRQLALDSPDLARDVEGLADTLRMRCPEYRRLQKPLFNRAVGDVCVRIGCISEPVEETESSDDDEAECSDAKPVPNKNMNSTVLSMYKRVNSGDALDGGIRTDTNGPVTVADKDASERSETEDQSVIRKRRQGTTETSARKKAKKGSRAGADYQEISTNSYEEMGGIIDQLQAIRELVEFPLRHPEVYAHLGVEPPRGVLLHGPPGCGKTLLANAIAGECGVPFFKVSAPEIVSGMSGESEQKLRSLFDEAVAKAPSIIFLDEIDAITPKRETAQREMERRIVAQLLTCIDNLTMERTGNRPVIVIGATNRPDSLDPALRRAGRFDREISMGIPDQPQREQILKVLCRNLCLSEEVRSSFGELARQTPGFVGADLAAVVKEAAMTCVDRIFIDLKSSAVTETLTPEQLQTISLELSDFLHAVKKVQPSAKREGFATVPDVTWDQVGALASVRDELLLAIVEPIKHPDLFKEYGLNNPTGMLLYGPPGCGKTLLAKAVANESGANFLSIKGPELLNKYVGESERAVRQVFARGRASAPCVLFFDELDALVPRRQGSEVSNGATERVVNQLLTELDGAENRGQVFVMGATNRPDIIDPAMLRPGRLDKLIYVPLPDEDGRLDILKTHIRGIPLHADVDLKELAHDKRLTGFSGADLASLVRVAASFALKRRLRSVIQRDESEMDVDSGEFPMSDDFLVGHNDFEAALKEVFPSVAEKDRYLYCTMKQRLQRSRGKLDKEGRKAESAETK